MCNIPIEERIEEFKKEILRVYRSHHLCLSPNAAWTHGNFEEEHMLFLDIDQLTDENISMINQALATDELRDAPTNSS